VRTARNFPQGSVFDQLMPRTGGQVSLRTSDTRVQGSYNSGSKFRGGRELLAVRNGIKIDMEVWFIPSPARQKHAEICKVSCDFALKFVMAQYGQPFPTKIYLLGMVSAASVGIAEACITAAGSTL